MTIYYTASQAARLLGLSEKTIRAAIRQGKLHAVHISKTRLGISREDLERLAAHRGIEIDAGAGPGSAQAGADRERLARLEREIEELRARLADVEAVLHKKPTPAPRPIPAPRQATLLAASEGQADGPGETIGAAQFAEIHGVNPRTMRDYLAGKRWNDRLDSVETGSAGGRPVHGLTPAQQEAAIKFWERHDVQYTPCAACPHNAG